MGDGVEEKVVKMSEGQLLLKTVCCVFEEEG